MSERPPKPTPEDRDEPIKLPLDPKEALKALLAVDPDDDPDENTPKS